MEALRKAEKKELMGKVTKYIGKELTILKEHKNWSYVEMALHCGVSQNRITEITSYGEKSYNVPVNEKNLARIIKGGLVTVDGIIKNVKMNTKEKEYVEGFIVYENKRLNKNAVSYQKKGYDPGKTMELANLLREEGVDVDELLKRALKKENTV